MITDRNFIIAVMPMAITISIILFSVIVSVQGGKVTYDYQICGKSMSPLINNNTWCSFHKVQVAQVEDLKVSDTICFNYVKSDFNVQNAQYICHQLIWIGEEHFCTKGLNNEQEDPCYENKYIALKVII